MSSILFEDVGEEPCLRGLGRRVGEGDRFVDDVVDVLLDRAHVGLGEHALAETEIYKLGQAYKIPSEPVDGMDVLAIREATARAVARARKDKVPALLEARTYRFRGHSMRDPAGAVYRTKEEVEREKLRDPIVLFKTRALETGASRRPM